MRFVEVARKSVKGSINMETDLLKMDLQYFAEGAEDDDTENAGASEEETEKVVSLSEMQRRLAKAEEKHNEERAALESSFEEKLQAAIEKAKTEAQLTGKELQQYKEKEAERKLQELREENERLKQDTVKRELRDEAMRTLGEKGMTVNDKVLEFVVKDTAEETLQAIDDMAELFKLQKEALAQTVPPRTSGGIGAAPVDKSINSILSKAKITDF